MHFSSALALCLVIEICINQIWITILKQQLKMPIHYLELKFNYYYPIPGVASMVLYIPNQKHYTSIPRCMVYLSEGDKPAVHTD